MRYNQEIEIDRKCFMPRCLVWAHKVTVTQSGEVPNWDARLTSLAAIATYTLPIRHVTSSSAIDLLSACANRWIYGKGLHLARELSFILAVEF